MNRQFTIKSRLWIVSQGGTFLGEGRVALLQAIDKFGSITKAAKSMKMSYLKAWKLVESMNETSPKALVKSESGGKGGGGTILTEHGHKSIKIFKELSLKHNTELNKAFEKQLIEF